MGQERERASERERESAGVPANDDECFWKHLLWRVKMMMMHCIALIGAAEAGSITVRATAAGTRVIS